MRSAVEQTDWHDETERAFLTKLAERLDSAINAGEAKGLIMIAPPRALGMIRQAYTQQLRWALRAEIDKDFVKLPVHEIEKHLGA
jgi:protein required for attachment to host cells